MNKTGLALILCLLMATAVPANALQQSNSQVQQLYAEAKTQEQSGHLDIAIEKYKEIIRLQPGMAAAYNNLGALYYRMMQLDEAILSLKRASELEPGLVAPKALLGLSYYQKGDFQNARRVLTLAKQAAPNDLNVKLYLSRSMIETGDLKDAKVLLEQLQAQDPNNEEVLYTLGSLYSVLAESEFGHIQSVNPNSYLLELLLGKASEARQIYADAAEHYKNAIARAPAVPELYYYYAHALTLSGNPEEALSAYKHALELNTYDYKSSYEEAALIVEQNPEDALALVNRSLELHPGNEQALIVRARALLVLNKPQEAVTDLKKADALNPDNEAIHFQLARAYRKLGKKEEAQAEDSIYERLQKENSDETAQLAQKHMNQNENANGSQPANQPPH